MMAMELTAYRVPEDPVFPSPANGHMVTSVVVYERGFGAPPHRLLPLIVVGLWPRAAQSDPLWGVAYCYLHDFVGGLHGD
jgi:hypothetical protein